MLHGRNQRHGPTVGPTYQRDRPGVETRDKGVEIVGVGSERELPSVICPRGAAEVAQIYGDESVHLVHAFPLTLPSAMVAGAAVHEHHSRAFALVLVGQAGTVHFKLLECWRLLRLPRPHPT